MAPPTVQAQVLVLLSAGAPRTSTLGEPGVQGATTAGTQGVGVPPAAVVSTLHVPNGAMFTAGA